MAWPGWKGGCCEGEGKKAKKVLVIVTGGTLIMKPSGTDSTLDVCPGFLSELVALPEWRHENLPDIDILEWDVLTDSAMMGLQHWIKIAEDRDIESAYFYYDGFVVVHGIDTMSYSAGALALMLEDLGMPVVFTGSQIRRAKQSRELPSLCLPTRFPGSVHRLWVPA